MEKVYTMRLAKTKGPRGASGGAMRKPRSGDTAAVDICEAAF
jgi:hypothetical protein